MLRRLASATSICSSSKFGPSLSYLVTLLSPSTGNIAAEFAQNVATFWRVARIDWPMRSLAAAMVHSPSAANPNSRNIVGRTLRGLVARPRVHRRDGLLGPD